MSSASAPSTRRTSTARSTGWPVRQAAIETALARRHLTAARWCSTTSRRATWRAAAARLPSSATTATARRASCRSSMACSARPTAARSRSRSSKARPATRPTLGNQVVKLKQRFGLDHVVLVGDRGMITQTRIAEDIKPAGFRLDHRAARPGDPRIARRRRVPDVAVRRSRQGRHHLTRLPGRALDPVPQPCAGRRARPANARTCSGPPSASWPASGPRSPASATRCRARRRSASPSAP